MTNRIEQPINFLNYRGERLWGFLTLPTKGSNFPALIMCHGFAKTKSERKFVELARSLAEKHIASLRFDFSGHGDSEGKLTNLSIENQAEELKSAYDFLAQNGQANKDKIAVLGHSLGALAAVLVQVKYRLAKTLILLSPALHQRELIKEWYEPQAIELWKEQGYLDTAKGRVGIQYLKGAESKDWSETVSRIQAPTLLLHGEADEDVLLKYTKDLFRKMNCQKKLGVVKGGDHHLESFDAKNKLLRLSSIWLKKYL